MKKIFLFKPARVWRYCGGGRAVIADSWEDAIKFFSEDRMAVSEEEAEKLAETAVASWDTWVLVATYVLEGDPPNGIVFSDQNWG